MPVYDRYLARLAADRFEPDPAQQAALREFADLHRRLDQAPVPEPSRGGGLRRFLKRSRANAPATNRGLYLWGGVGRGKTHLADLFYAELPFEQKLRLHFHQFMQQVHAERARLGHVSEPLELVARHFAARARVLCLDEMQVTDITDAMIIHALLSGLFRRGVTLVTTSNLPPDDLYRGGLQRARFVPAIDLLKQHTEVLQLDAGVDYRLRALERAEIYHTPLDEMARFNLDLNFKRLSTGPARDSSCISVNDREIPVRKWADGVVWFEFADLCEGPRGKDDYLEIARCFHTVLLGGIRVMDEKQSDAARRFVNLIDVLYDHGVKLIASAQTEPQHLYVGKRLGFEFERTVSRLLEMRSRDYLARGHLAD